MGGLAFTNQADAINQAEITLFEYHKDLVSMQMRAAINSANFQLFSKLSERRGAGTGRALQPRKQGPPKSPTR